MLTLGRCDFNEQKQVLLLYVRTQCRTFMCTRECAQMIGLLCHLNMKNAQKIYVHSACSLAAVQCAVACSKAAVQCACVCSNAAVQMCMCAPRRQCNVHVCSNAAVQMCMCRQEWSPQTCLRLCDGLPSRNSHREVACGCVAERVYACACMCELMCSCTYTCA